MVRETEKKQYAFLSQILSLAAFQGRPPWPLLGYAYAIFYSLFPASYQSHQTYKEGRFSLPVELPLAILHITLVEASRCP